jgi:SAM-dependent methyltransferase
VEFSFSNKVQPTRLGLSVLCRRMSPPCESDVMTQMDWHALFRSILAILGGIAIYLVFMVLIGARILRRFVHFPAPFFVGYFLDSDLRRRMQPPDKLLARSGIGSGMSVLEIGCGSGSYTTFAAREVGEQGMLYALDIQNRMLKQLEAKLAKDENREIHNIELVLGSATDLSFKSNSLDLVLLITVLEEIPDRHRSLHEIMRVLKPGGKLAVTEFLLDPDYPFMRTTIRTVTEVGFLLDGQAGDLFNYTVRFRAPTGLI